MDQLKADPELCRDCQICTLSCSLYHEGVCSLRRARLVVSKDMARYEFQIVICHHCSDPECFVACPSDAMRLDERGVVLLDAEVCVRCGACAAACPYEAIVYDEATDTYRKCDLCAGRAAGPICAERCPTGALTCDPQALLGMDE